MCCLHSDFNTGSLTPVELTAVDVLDKAMEHCRNCMVSEGHTHTQTHTDTHTHARTYSIHSPYVLHYNFGWSGMAMKHWKRKGKCPATIRS